MNINQSFMVENVVNQNYSFNNNDNLFTIENYEPTIKILGIDGIKYLIYLNLVIMTL